jgi:hypothetical protein
MTVERRMMAAATALAVALVAGIVAIALWVVPERRDDIWVDLARAGIQLVVIIGLGGVVSSVLRFAEASRDRRRLRDERRFGIFEQLVTAYHRLKFVRRNLRMVGIRSRPDVLRAEQVEALRTGMQTITEVQLTLEEVLRSPDARSVFENAAAIHDHLSALASYVGSLVDEWEHHGKCFWVDQQTRKVGDCRGCRRSSVPPRTTFGRMRLSRWDGWSGPCAVSCPKESRRVDALLGPQLLPATNRSPQRLPIPLRPPPERPQVGVTVGGGAMMNDTVHSGLSSGRSSRSGRERRAGPRATERRRRIQPANSDTEGWRYRVS